MVEKAMRLVKNTKKTDKRMAYIMRGSMSVLTAVLIVLFFGIMSMVSSIQGTARVVNYAGLVRGCTQRIIKLEDAGQPQDGLIESVTSYIQGLRYGSEDLNLVRLDDRAFQEKMEELDAYFQELKAEILLVREKGYENTQIIEKSEHFFGVCDEATGLAEAYSQRKASALSTLEKIVVADIIGLVLLLAFELVKALRYAAQNRILQSKVYLDEATGLPNKNKCEEVLEQPVPGTDGPGLAVCSFDLNNLRTINNNCGHEKGDEYIRAFAQLLRKVVPESCFVGRNGGDEFLAVLRGMNHVGVRECLRELRHQADLYSAEHPDLPISYASGYALSGDHEGSDMRELFRFADKNMYVDKNRAKMEEAARQQHFDSRLLEELRRQSFYFSDCIYCDALLDQYRVLRASSDFFLAEDGSYSGAVEQIAQELATTDNWQSLWKKLQLSFLKEHLWKDARRLDIPFVYEDGACTHQGRLTVLFHDATADGRLHHFVLGMEEYHENAGGRVDEKQQLIRYYDQLKQSVLENSNYVDALMDSAEAVYSVDLTNDRLENVFYHVAVRSFDLQVATPCSYDAYCRERSAFVTEETLENYRITDSAYKLLERFAGGDKQVTVEYQEKADSGELLWLQKTVLMSRNVFYHQETKQEREVIRAIILFKNTSAFHEKEEREKERLQEAYASVDSASRAKTEFLHRLSHDVRTPINGILGMLEIIRKNREDGQKVDECLDKMRVSASHLLDLVNDVLDMSKIEAGQGQAGQEAFSLPQLMDEVAALMSAQLTQAGLTHRRHREDMHHTALLGSPVLLRQIMVNLFSNAVKYNRPGGCVDTSAREIFSDGTTVFYEFQITDTGIGMSESFVKEQLFQPFTKEKTDGGKVPYQGSGLGMSIVKGLLEQMQGSMQVHSALGVGTTFTFQIPFLIDKEAEPQTDESGETAGKELSGIRVLLVEDNEINMEIAQFYLTDHGAQVAKATNGQEAVALLAASVPDTYDVVLMDLQMPVMGGLEASRRIRELESADAKTLPILAMTAQGSEGTAQQCKDAGMCGYILKPIEPHDLIGQILRHRKTIVFR